MMRLPAAAMASVLMLMVACSEGSSGDSGSEFADVCPDDLPGPTMVKMSTPEGTQYCIDSTEVTQEQYAAFIAADVPQSEQPHALCVDRNPEFYPRQGFETTCPAGSYAPGETPIFPVVCVDFCDAVAYCHWAGKRLCGVVGRAGEVFGSWRDPESEFNRVATDPNQSQWYDACSDGGANEYPYGEDYDSACGGLAEVGTRTSCATPTDPPVFDLSGNVEEWEDLCAEEGDCHIRGGHSDSGGSDSTCAHDAVTGPYLPGPGTGFRCCYEF